jgi:hypothetical protein
MNMGIEQIVRRWKAGEEELPGDILLENPVGEQLSEQALAEVVGGLGCSSTYCPLTLTQCFPYTNEV